MTTNGRRTTIGGIGLMLIMLLGIVATESATAQYRNYDPADQYRRDVYQTRWDRDRERRYAYLLGYHQAYSEGRDADRRVSYKDMPGYREGTNGYLVWMGDRNTYRDSYRKGYKDGFEDARRYRPRRYDRDDVERTLGAALKDVYNDDRYGRYDRNDPYHEGRQDRSQFGRIAQQNGHRDGLRHGDEDRARRREYGYDHSSNYRNASRGYRSEYGDRDRYRQAYRDAYRGGYDEGYRRSNRQSDGHSNQR